MPEYDTALQAEPSYNALYARQRTNSLALEISEAPEKSMANLKPVSPPKKFKRISPRKINRLIYKKTKEYPGTKTLQKSRLASPKQRVSQENLTKKRATRLQSQTIDIDDTMQQRRNSYRRESAGLTALPQIPAAKLKAYDLVDKFTYVS